jgi:hypothetical protein
MKMKRRSESGLSRTVVTILSGVAALGLLLFLRELPALRRYVRIERM